MIDKYIFIYVQKCIGLFQVILKNIVREWIIIELILI